MVAESSVLLIHGASAQLARWSNLLRLDCFVVAVPSARQALKRLRSVGFDLVIMELNLPDLNGLCLLSILRRLYPGLPVVVLTEDTSVENMIKALSLGADGYLQLPDDRSQVLACIREILRGAHAAFQPAPDVLVLQS